MPGRRKPPSRRRTQTVDCKMFKSEERRADALADLMQVSRAEMVRSLVLRECDRLGIVDPGEPVEELEQQLHLVA